MTKYRSCVACTKPVRRTYMLCADCYSTYYQYRNEEWFKELLRLQNKQDMIDMLESGLIPFGSKANLYGDNLDMPRVPLRNKIGAPSLSTTVAQKILDIYDECKEKELAGRNKISFRGIAKQLEQRHNIKVSYVMVWKIVGKYRNGGK